MGDIPMEEPVMGEENMKEELENLKEGKAAGINKIKPEVYKELNNSKICKEVMRNGYNKIIRGGKYQGVGN